MGFKIHLYLPLFTAKSEELAGLIRRPPCFKPECLCVQTNGCPSRGVIDWRTDQVGGRERFVLDSVFLWDQCYWGGKTRRGGRTIYICGGANNKLMGAPPVVWLIEESIRWGVERGLFWILFSFGTNAIEAGKRGGVEELFICSRAQGLFPTSQTNEPTRLLFPGFFSTNQPTKPTRLLFLWLDFTNSTSQLPKPTN